MEESTGVLLTDLAGESFRFDPGAASLRWALSGGEGYRAAYEQLHGPDGLAAGRPHQLQSTWIASPPEI
jgi:hypothetical protein